MSGERLYSNDDCVCTIGSHLSVKRCSHYRLWKNKLAFTKKTVKITVLMEGEMESDVS